MAASLQIRLTGGAGNSNPNLSLGGVMSSTQLSATPMNNLFDNVDPTEAENGDVEYRALDIHNAGDAAATSISLYLSSETTSPSTDLDFGLDATTQSVGAEGTAPSGVTFDHYNSSNKLSISDIAAGSSQRFWVRRTVNSGAANLNNDTCTLKVEYA